jgi:RHS repeat-associated protein
LSEKVYLNCGKGLKYRIGYYPFGEQLPGRNSMSDYRYAFQGQELDKETGMEAFQLRLWDGRIGRWLNPDPMGQYASPYLGMGNNPVNGVDRNGGWFGDPPTDGSCSDGDTWDDGTNSWTMKDGAWISDSWYSGGISFLEEIYVSAGGIANDLVNDKFMNFAISSTSMFGSSAEGIVENRLKYFTEAQRAFDRPITVKTFFNVGIETSQFRLEKIAKIGRTASHIGNVLFVADIALGGQVKASHVFYGGVMAINAIPVAGNIISGVIFAADLLLMGGTYMYSGHATSIGDIIDENTNGGVILNARDLNINYDGVKGYRK